MVGDENYKKSHFGNYSIVLQNAAEADNQAMPSEVYTTIPVSAVIDNVESAEQLPHKNQFPSKNFPSDVSESHITPANVPNVPLRKFTSQYSSMNSQYNISEQFQQETRKNPPINSPEKRPRVVKVKDLNDDSSSDLDLLENEVGYEQLLTPKPSFWSDAMTFINKLSERIDTKNHQEKDFLSLLSPPTYNNIPVSYTATYRQPFPSSIIPIPQYSTNYQRLSLNNDPTNQWTSADDNSPTNSFLLPPIAPVNTVYGGGADLLNTVGAVFPNGLVNGVPSEKPINEVRHYRNRTTYTIPVPSYARNAISELNPNKHSVSNQER